MVYSCPIYRASPKDCPNCQWYKSCRAVDREVRSSYNKCELKPDVPGGVALE